MRPKDAVDPLKQDGVVYKIVTIGFSTECLKQSVTAQTFFYIGLDKQLETCL